MNETEKENSDNSEGIEESEKKSRRLRPTRKTQSQVLQQALNIQPDDLKNIEDKLAVVKFLDYITEEPLDFAFKDRAIGQYKEKIKERMDKFASTGEEDKLIKKGFEDKKILEAVERIKTRTEEIAISKGMNKSVEKKFRNLNFIMTGALVGVFIVFIILQVTGIITDTSFMLPFLCVLCIIPQFLRSSVTKKWYRFKEENRNEVYTINREDILVIKSYVSEVLANVRSNLIELKVPLELIKFSLFHRDYEDFNVINQRQMKGLTEYFVTFEYPEGIEPFPIPKTLQQQYNQPVFAEKKRDETPEKNFIVLTEMKGKDGIITSFLPSLKDNLAEKINKMLTDSDFSEPDIEFSSIIPNYPTDTAIYCVCGEIAKIETVHVCEWKNKFKFYLFVAKECTCGEQIYAISLMDEADIIPKELQDIF
ncbi:MAG: hypothetical protein HWN79_08040 [Candidatus Lokiarchaeota archaeon]|nr:hypothetical protein [Candidatus Lokiarchaeota archaeon]